MPRRLLTVLLVGSLAALFAGVAAVLRDFARLVNSEPSGWRE